MFVLSSHVLDSIIKVGDSCWYLVEHANNYISGSVESGNGRLIGLF